MQSQLTRFFDLAYECLEHIVPSDALSAIEAERIFIQVHLQILRGDAVIDAANAVLCGTPEAFNRVRVCIARDIDTLTVMDTLVLIAAPFERVVGDIFVREDDALGQYSLLDMRNERCSLGVRNNFSYNFAAAFNQTEYGRFASAASPRVLPFIPMLVFLQSAIETFVRFNLAGQWPIFIEHRADLVKDTPCAFVRNAKLPLQLFGADSASRRSHQVHGIKPEFQRRGRILKDCADHRMLMTSTELAAIGRASLGAMMLGYLLAFRAENSVGVEPFNQLLKASCVVWILALELHQRIGGIRSARTERIVAIDLAHRSEDTKRRYIRQGDTYPRMHRIFGAAEARPDRKHLNSQWAASSIRTGLGFD